jgi:hypothetical protein
LDSTSQLLSDAARQQSTSREHYPRTSGSVTSFSAFSVPEFQHFRTAHGQLSGGEGTHGQGKEQRKEGRKEVRREKGETKEVTLATAFSEK